MCNGLLPLVSPETHSSIPVLSVAGCYSVINGEALERLALTLLVAWVFANDHNASVTTDDLALVANWLNAGVNLHDVPFRCPRTARDSSRPLLTVLGVIICNDKRFDRGSNHRG